MRVLVETYCVYYDIRDYPKKYVVRRFATGFGPDKTPVVVSDSLAAARAAVPNGMVCLTRHSSDDPAIVETWI